MYIELLNAHTSSISKLSDYCDQKALKELLDNGGR